MNVKRLAETIDTSSMIIVSMRRISLSSDGSLNIRVLYDDWEFMVVDEILKDE